MPVRGKIYIRPNPQEQTWEMLVHNTGDEPYGITQNILPANDPNLTAHDDHVLNGHGLGVNPGKFSRQKFHLGDVYNHQGNSIQHTIGQDSFLRVGIRAHANMTIPLPDLNGPPVVLDLADFNWYSGSPDTARPGFNNWAGSREHVSDAADGAQVLEEIEALIAQSETGVKCEGLARITAVKNETGRISHWEVWFENPAEQPWIGTVSFVDAEKNDGIGLESMGMPGANTAAMQRIEYLGNYGIEADVGRAVRLGVRGYAWTKVTLPADGSIEIPISKFKIDASKISDEFFDRAAILEKRNEKKDRVQFFENGAAINDALKPKVHRGAEAVKLSTFNPPDLELKSVPDTKTTPGGGWTLTLKSNCPEFDEKGRVGFVAAILLEGANPDSAAAKTLGPKKFLHGGHEKTWFIPKGVDLGGRVAEEGAVLKVATRGLGWFAEIPLPAAKKSVRARTGDELWGLREDQQTRRALRPEVVNRYRG